MTKAILLLSLGLALVIAEVLVPSAGMLGIVAGVCIVGSIVWAFTISVQTGMMLLIATVVLLPAVVTIAFKILPHSPLAKKLMARGFSFDEGRGVDLRDQVLLGRSGTVEAPLRPVGTARIDGRRVDVMSRGELVESGTAVRVIEVKGNRVVVARESNESSPPEATSDGFHSGHHPTTP
ncbi:MAG: hypothetical protein GY711_35495 [bacterium]|nr:hypothetical protein [bacterium]